MHAAHGRLVRDALRKRLQAARERWVGAWMRMAVQGREEALVDGGVGDLHLFLLILVHACIFVHRDFLQISILFINRIF